jgi:hypothetical protein
MKFQSAIVKHANEQALLIGMFAIGFICFSCLIICNMPTEPLWDSFSDSNDYINQSKNELFSMDFLSPGTDSKFAPRPFTVPLFLKIAGSNPFHLVLFQRIFYCLCVLVLILTISFSVTDRYLKLIFQFILLYFFTMWDLVGWSGNILSEFLSSALMFLWFSCVIIFYRKPGRLSLSCLIAVSILLSFSRDTWPYIILVLALLNFIVFKLTKQQGVKLSVFFLVFSIALFLVQNSTANRGERYKLPVFNSIVGRVSKNDRYVDWFKQQGMPMCAEVVADFRAVDAGSRAGMLNICKKYYDGSYTPLFEWIRKDGKSVYRNFVISHPDYFFLTDQTNAQVQRLFCVDLHSFGYFQQPDGFFVNAATVFPLFNIWHCMILTALCVMLFFRQKNSIYLLPATLFILFTCNALLSYNADALEVERHLYITQIVLEFVCFISVLFLTDYGIRMIKAKRQGKHPVIPDGVLQN